MVNEKNKVINGKSIFYIEKPFKDNNQNDFNVLFLPGWPLSCVSLRNIINSFPDNYRCISLDIPGYGKSKSDYKTYHTFDYYTDFLSDFVDQEFINKDLIVFGYSLGGVHAINLARKRNDKVKKLIVFSTPYNATEHMTKDFRKHRSLKTFLKLVINHENIVKIVDIYILKKEITKYIIDKIYYSKYPGMKNLNKEFMSELVNDTAYFNLKALSDIAYEMTYSDFKDEAESILQNSLVLSAENDTAVPSTISKYLARDLFPNGTYLEIPDSDHAIGLYNPKLFSDLVVNFIEDKEELFNV